MRIGEEAYALPLIPLVLLILIIFLGSPSLTLKYGAAALTSLKGAVLCNAMIVSHCLSVICAILIVRSNHYVVNNRMIFSNLFTLWITPSHVKPALLTII